jgi:hypothetical protein
MLPRSKARVTALSVEVRAVTLDAAELEGESCALSVESASLSVEVGRSVDRERLRSTDRVAPCRSRVRPSSEEDRSLSRSRVLSRDRVDTLSLVTANLDRQSAAGSLVGSHSVRSRRSRCTSILGHAPRRPRLGIGCRRLSRDRTVRRGPRASRSHHTAAGRPSCAAHPPTGAHTLRLDAAPHAPEVASLPAVRTPRATRQRHIVLPVCRPGVGVRETTGSG